MSRSVAIIGTRGYPSYYGGFETLVRHLSPYLADQGWNVTVYSRSGDTTRAGDPDRRVRVVESPSVDAKSLSTLSHGFSSSLHAAATKPDVALVMNVANGYYLPILRRAGIPTVVNVDGIEWEREKWGPVARRAFKHGAKLTARYGDRLVFDAQAIAEYWDREWGATGDYIPYGGVDLGTVPPAPELAGKRYALMVARLVPENGITAFIDAAQLLMPKWDVAVVGTSGIDDDFDAMMRKLAVENESFHWFGHMANDLKLYSLWQNAGAYFHGHKVGGTNPALVQAMVSGAAIVARDTVYNREVLGDSGLFVPAEPALIARQIDTLMGDDGLRTRLGVAARERGKKLYTWDSVCAEYEGSLRAAIEDRTA